MRRIFTILFLLVSIASFSQKVKLKKDKVIVDDVEAYKYEKEGNMHTFSSLSGSEEFISVLRTEYQTRNDNYYRTQNPSKYGITPLTTKYVYTVKFLKSGKELFTEMDAKDVIKTVFKANLVDENGLIDEGKLDVFITKYNNENLKLKIN